MHFAALSSKFARSWAFAASCALLSLNARAQTTWTGTTSTDWQTVSNWTDGKPTSDTVAIIGNNNTVVLSGGSGATSTFYVGASSTANLTVTSGATLTTGVVLLGNDSSENQANVTISGSGTTWTANSNFFIGDYGTANVTVSNGATVSAPEFNLGWNGSALGQVTVSNATLSTSGVFYVGFEGVGNLTVGSGGLVSATGGIRINNSSSTLRAAGGFGATSSLGNSTVDNWATLAGNDFLSGNVTINGGAILAPDAGGRLRFDHKLTLEDGAILSYTLGAAAQSFASIYTNASSANPLTVNGNITINVSNAGDFTAGTYTLLDWSVGGATGISSASVFSLDDTLSGYDYNLAIVGSTLQLTASAIPEPSTCAAIFGAGVLGFAIWRGRAKSRLSRAR